MSTPIRPDDISTYIGLFPMRITQTTVRHHRPAPLVAARAHYARRRTAPAIRPPKAGTAAGSVATALALAPMLTAKATL